MDANRTYLLAQNGTPGEYIVSQGFNARALPSQNPNSNIMHRRDSIGSFDSLAREKEEAQTTITPRSGLRTTFSKVARRLSGAGKGKQLSAGRVAVAESSVHEHEPFQVYVVGEQVVYLGPGSNRRTRKESERKREEIMYAEMERVKVAKERRMSTGHWDDGGVASDARVMRRTS